MTMKTSRLIPEKTAARIETISGESKASVKSHTDESAIKIIARKSGRSIFTLRSVTTLLRERGIPQGPNQQQDLDGLAGGLGTLGKPVKGKTC